MMKRIFGLLVIGCVLYACSPILKYGKYSYKCRGLRGLMNVLTLLLIRTQHTGLIRSLMQVQLIGQVNGLE